VKPDDKFNTPVKGNVQYMEAEASILRIGGHDSPDFGMGGRGASIKYYIL